MKKRFRIEGRVCAAATALCGLLFLGCRPAQAHFLWADIVQAPPPVLRLTFSEEGTGPTSPRLLGRISAAKAWTVGGSRLTLVPGDGAQTSPLSAASRVAAAEQTWGIYDASAQGLGVFLLRYYAKAASDTASASTRVGLPLEVFARRQGGQFIARVSSGGRPAPAAEVWVQAPGAEEPSVLKADARGEVRFAVAAAGECRLRAMVAEAVHGDYKGKKYALVRNYSTLTFPVDAQTPAASTPDTAQADPAAYALLKAAHDARQTFRPDFPGLTARVAFNDNGVAHAGTLSFDPAGDTHVSVPGLPAEAKEWLDDQIGSFISHRQQDDFAGGEGRNPLTLGPDDHNPLGRVVMLHDRLQSSYRIKDAVLTEVTRTMAGQRFTITVMETTAGDAGKYLPHQFAVTYFDAKSGAITSENLFTDTFSERGGVWLPVARRVIQAKDGTFTTRTLTLSDLQVRKP